MNSPIGLAESLAEIDRRNGRAPQLPTPENGLEAEPEPRSMDDPLRMDSDRQEAEEARERNR